RAFGEQIEAAVPPLPPAQVDRNTSRRFRVGFLSGDLREHSCARFLAPLFDYLPRERLEVWGLHNAIADDALTAPFKAAPGGWVPISTLGATDAAMAARSAGIDILIDCAGFTAGNRLDVCAARPAPVQMTFLGYPNTTGLSRIDYR